MLMEWLRYQAEIPNDYFRVSLALIHRAQVGSSVGLTMQELSRMSGMSTLVIGEALEWFKKNPKTPLLAIRKHKGVYKINLHEYYVGLTEPVLFTYEDTDQKRIATLEQALRRADIGKSAVDRSELSKAVSPDESVFVIEIEQQLGRALTLTDAYYLGKLIKGYGLERVRTLFRQKRTANDPLRAVYAILDRGGRGKSWTSDTPKPVTYTEL